MSNRNRAAGDNTMINLQSGDQTHIVIPPDHQPNQIIIIQN